MNHPRHLFRLFSYFLNNLRNKHLQTWAGALVQWLWEETQIPNGVGLNPGTVNWMDISSHLFVVKFCNVCLKRPKINEKRPGLAHLKKHLQTSAELSSQQDLLRPPKTGIFWEPIFQIFAKNSNAQLVALPPS